MHVEHPESSIATLEKVVPMTVKVILMNGDRGIEGCWKLNDGECSGQRYKLSHFI